MGNKKRNKTQVIIEKTSSDKTLRIVVFILVSLGLALIASASSVRGKTLHGDTAFFLNRHVQRVILGILMMFILSQINYRKLRYCGFPLLFLSIGMLVWLLIPGSVEPIKGSKRFLFMAGQSIQPSEFAKFALVLFLADSVIRRGEDLQSVPGYLTRLTVIVIVSGLIILQPDFSTAVLIGLIGVHTLMLGGAKIKHLVNTFLAFTPVIIIIALAATYRLRRLKEFIEGILHPENISHHINQSLIALGDGGFLGLGVGKSLQKKYYLPEPFTDFIFSILGEEMGFIGASVTVLLFVIIVFRGVVIARRAPDKFGFVLAGSISFIIGTYAMVNLLVVTGMLPVSGLPLPFLAYGGSSIIVTFSMVGILLNISKYRVRAGV